MDTRTTRRLVCAAGAIAVVLAVSCNNENPQISASDYDRSCSMNSDCALAWAGDVCSCDDVVALNAGEIDGFQDRRSSLQEDCSSKPDCSSGASRWRPVCNAGTCVVDSRPPDVGDDTSGGMDTTDATDTTEPGDTTAPTDTSEPSDTTDNVDADGTDGTDGTDGVDVDTGDGIDASDTNGNDLDTELPDG